MSNELQVNPEIYYIDINIENRVRKDLPATKEHIEKYNLTAVVGASHYQAARAEVEELKLANDNCVSRTLHEARVKQLEKENEILKSKASQFESTIKATIEARDKFEKENTELKVELQGLKEEHNLCYRAMIKKLQELEKENTEMKAKHEELLSYLPKVPTEPYEKELAKKCTELEKENAELKAENLKIKTLNVLDGIDAEKTILMRKVTKLTSALRVAKEALELPDLDCGDNSCRFVDRTKPMGMRTNGGCRCLDKPSQSILIRRFLLNAKEALKQIDEVLK